jgi:hypothetical protein
MHEGKLFLVETDRIARPGESAAPPFVRAKQPQRLVEHFWLCDVCAAQWTIAYDRESRVALVALRKPTAMAPAHSPAHQEVA